MAATSEQNILLKTNLTNRIYGLDILRAVAVLIVLIGHTIHYAPSIVIHAHKYFFLDGVTVFFVLSGFLIGTILIKSFNKEEIRVSTILTFWLNRWLRTLPPYFFMLIILIVVVLFFGVGVNDTILDKKTILSYFVFLQNWNWVHPSFFGEAWSLAVEEWFYFLTPLVYVVVYKLSCFSVKRSFIVTIMLMIILPAAFRYFKHATGYFTDPSIYYQSSYHYYDIFFRKQVLTRLDSIMFGVLGAYISYYYNDIWVKNKYISSIIGVVLFIVILVVGRSGYLYINVFSFSIAPFMILFFLPLLSNIRYGTGYVYKITTYISLISYSLYLTHYTLIEYCIMPYFDNLPIHDILKWFIFWGIAIGLSTLMYLYIEKPFMNLRHKIKKLNINLK